MGRFRRRKPAVAWLPHVQHNAQAPQVGWWISSFTVAAAQNTIGTSIFTMLPDYPAEAIRQAGDLPSLADFEGSAYRLRRIVGKLFIGLDQTITQAPDSRPKNALIGAGFIILKVDENTGAPINPTANSYSPLDNNNLRDPWIWRRTWMLTNDFSNNLTEDYEFPRSTTDYGSVLDGSHIDQKTARRVSDEERLFFVISTVNPGLSTTLAGGGTFILDYRVIASPMRVSGNRGNASR